MTDTATQFPRSSGRSQWIEWTRVLGCAGIVWFHAGAPFRTVALGGLIAFTIMGCAFIKPVATTGELRSAIWSRAQRLLGPWLIWSVVYGALRVAEAIRQHEGPFSWWDDRMVLYGTWIHLWFLPFLFLATVVVLALGLVDREKRFGAVNIFAWVLIGLTPLWVWLEQWGAGKPFDQWISVLPAVGLGVLMRGAMPGSTDARRRAFTLLIVDAIVIGATLALFPDRGASVVKHVVGGLAVLAWAPAATASRLALALGALSMGVYLIHPLLLTIGERVLGMPTSSAITAAGAIVASFAASALLGWGGRWGMQVVNGILHPPKTPPAGRQELSA